MSRPSWQLPAGVSRGTWDYAQAEHIARDYDEYFAACRLFEFDEAIAARWFTTPGVVADFGCGTGRALIPLLRRGHQGLAIDLSREMLAVTVEKAAAENLPLTPVLANLVECDAVADAAAHYGMCLFSTLGMIRGHVQRIRALRHMARILRPGGVLVIHVHNVWYNLYDPGGPWWLLGNLWQSLRGGELEFGDKFYQYRGIPNMFLHVFRRSELLGALRAAGLEPVEVVPLAPGRYSPLRAPWLLSNLRANGWIVAASKAE